ncbi:xylose ABC transporter ATP-binding protein [Ruminiclostridium cellobioparum]|uniref:xylose ABC transporter ATP-binding protein n=1 Tax=Ruminiclostridium cellobioparum TaxID=29355 RepID=UPI0028A955B6|nr:xylose ABC transporter ATP-binding protein [Ruminiclostridium cellobioparum]
MSEYILEMKNITKEFPGVRALDDVTFKVKKGEIHALCGENGAGKSTLMKVLSGVYPTGTYTGEIIVKGSTQSYSGIKDSERAGIAIIYQELALVKQMSVCENIFLGNEKVKKTGLIDWDKSYAESQKVLNEVRLNINPNTKVLNLGIGQQQLVEIAKAIAKKAEILILDEPSAALTESETENLLQILKELKSKGVTCIYISHKLNEVFEIADNITILRDGKTVGTEPASEITENKVIAKMVGRELTQRFPRKEHKPGQIVMEVKNWNVHNPDLPELKLIDNASFKVRKGEILGIAGLMGAGRTELVMSIFGAYGTNVSGELILEGKKVSIKNPKQAIKSGISYVSEDRKRYGLVLGMDIKNNVTLSSLEAISKLTLINSNEVIKNTNQYVEDLRIKTPSIEQKASNLSGGNQQKVVLAKWLMTKPKILIMDEPTRGIDVGAKFEIYNIMNKLIDEGVCIIMISSELPEILGMSDRILVMHEGRLTKEFNWEEATQENILTYATGGM